jgi:hypothetical protein
MIFPGQSLIVSGAAKVAVGKKKSAARSKVGARSTAKPKKTHKQR